MRSHRIRTFWLESSLLIMLYSLVTITPYPRRRIAQIAIRGGKERVEKVDSFLGLHMEASSLQVKARSYISCTEAPYLLRKQTIVWVIQIL